MKCEVPPFRRFLSHSNTSGLVVAPLAAVLLSLAPLCAWETYHDPAQDDLGYCSTCHPGFRNGRSDTLHALHTGGTDPITSTCDLCHTGNGRNNPLTMWSNNNGLGCAGCHGRDYGETIGANHANGTATFPTQGLPKNSGRGLRRHHAGAGITVCADCHADAEPYPENVMNPVLPGLNGVQHYYFLESVSLGGLPVDSCLNEDTANDADNEGLDNDGDGLYDENDPDCNPDPLLVTIEPLMTGALQLSWPAPTAGWLLQENADLNTDAWVDVGAPTERVNGFWRFEATPPPNEPRFYRLIKRP